MFTNSWTVKKFLGSNSTVSKNFSFCKLCLSCILESSEINTEAAAVKRRDYVIEESVQNMYCDELLIKVLKYIYGVHKKALGDDLT